MKPLRLDFARATDAPARIRWLLLAVGVFFAFDVARTWTGLEAEAGMLEARLAAVSASTPTRVTSPAPREEELLAARAVARSFAVPWPRLFAALEAVPRDALGLTGIEPDPAGGTARVSGEARDYPSILTYVARLAEQPGLERVHLVRHEQRAPRPGGQPWHFEVLLTWSARAK